MRLIFLEKENFEENLYYLSFEDSKHLFANRYKINDSILAVLGDKIGEFTIKKINKKIIYGSFNPKSLLEKPLYKLNLIIGLPKDRALNPIIEKSAEIGVNNIFIIPLEFSNRKDFSLKNILRLNKILKEGCKQSGNPFIPEIYYLDKITQIDNLTEIKDDFKILLDENCQKKQDFFTLINDNRVENFKKISIFIGPEGGISNNERTFLLNKGFNSVTVSKNILRTETAAISSMFFWRLYQSSIFKI